MATATLFVTRKFPPSVGGMETLASDVWATLSAGGDGRDRLIAHGGPNARMPLWLPGAVLRTVRLVRRREVGYVLVGDVLLYLLLRPVLVLLRVPHATMAMGKDVVWRQPVYQRLVRLVLPRAPRVLAISAATAATVVDAGAPADRVVVVRLGVRLPEGGPARDAARAELKRRFAVPEGATVLVTVGRLVRRKGVAWFLDTVLPEVPGAVHLVAGSGEDADRIAAAVAAHGLGDRVRLLGAVDDVDRELLMRGADVFVQPNVPVAGDMEGFGLVAVEAAVRGSLVLAADLEGLRDAVLPGETGELLPSGDAEVWRAALDEVAADPVAAERRAERYASRCREVYSREQMGAQLRLALGAASTPPNR
ncbi:glycosyltransferase family 4 protein [Cellulomonas sp. GbtcB1]|uniref:glycosyltransferase family 4 protein n=1 Tax=Cellulomonas sp. GbtcB1 TaxID=2824746 RepID=UPI001C2FFD4B|nr:glycosyltransferase family 4 protein [Cellulomonas sp. GbtcB1]